MTKLLMFFCACLYLMMGRAEAQLYRWVDEQGKVQYGDQIPAKYNDGASTMLNNQGVATKKTEASLTSAQRQAFDVEKKKQAESDLAKREQDRKDKALLAAYSKPEDIDKAERRQLELIEQNILVTETRMKELNTRVTDLQIKLKANPKQLALEKEHQMLDAELPMLGKRVSQWQQEIVVIKQRFEGERTRFAWLTAPVTPRSATKIKPNAL